MGGGIYSSTNGGASWRPSNAPATNWSWIASSADGVRLVAAQLGDYLNENGGIYTSVDSGRHWSLSGAGAAAWFSVASSADGNRLVAAAFHTNSYNFPGMISISTNAGANWGPAGAPADYWTTVACSADGSKLVAGGSGALYTSTDFGASWTSNSMPYQYWRCVASSADGARLSGVANLDRVYTAIAGPSPLMNSALTEGGLVLSWTWPSSEVVLRQSAELAGLNWNDVTGTPTLVLTNLQYQVTVAASSGQSFYRLEKR
jgi:hypothetical protein